VRFVAVGLQQELDRSPNVALIVDDEDTDPIARGGCGFKDCAHGRWKNINSRASASQVGSIRG
jgi:hypothetical protein